MGKAIKKAQEIAAEAAETAAKTEGKEMTAQTDNGPAEAQNGLEAAALAGVSAEELAQAATEVSNAMAALPDLDPPDVTLDELEGMDIDVFALEDVVVPRPVWRIADDGCADWAVRKIAEERAELNRIKELAEAQISRIEEKVAAAERRYKNGTEFLTGKLAEYFMTVPHKTTKTKHSYRLLSGSLVMKIGQPTMSKDDKKLVEHLRAAGLTELIKVKEEPAWGEFKKRLEIVGGSAVDRETGEIVDGVTVETKPDTFVVDV